MVELRAAFGGVVVKSHWAAGQHNLRGKRTKMPRCRCCVVQDLRPKAAFAELPQIIAAGIEDYGTSRAFGSDTKGG